MKNGLIFLGFIVGFIVGLLYGVIVAYSSEHDFSYRVRCWLDNMNKSRLGVVYIVRKSHTDLYLKEDYSYSKLGKGLAPLLFYSADSARQTMELLEWENSNWEVIETTKDILSNVVSWSRSEKSKKENFHKFGHSIDFDKIEVNPLLSANENRKKLITEDKKKSCFNCKHGEFDHGYFCNYADAYMIGTTMCRFWEIKKGEEDA